MPSPSVSTTTYTVTVTNNGCTDTDQVTVFVNNAVANAGPDQTICLGQSVSLTATGGGSYQWSHGLGNTATVNANPSVSTTTYTVTVTNNGCTDTDQVTVFVNNAVANAGPDQTICLGQSVSLTATGGGSLSVESFGLGNSCDGKCKSRFNDDLYGDGNEQRLHGYGSGDGLRKQRGCECGTRPNDLLGSKRKLDRHGRGQSISGVIRLGQYCNGKCQVLAFQRRPIR